LSGVPVVQAGETVEKGQLLVSGDVEIMDDYGTVINHHYVASDATVYANTSYAYSDTFLLAREEKVYTGRKLRTFYVEVLGHRLALWPLPKTFDNSSKFLYEYPLHLTENFYLPVIFGSVVEEEYEIVVKPYSKMEAEALAKANLNEFLQKLMQKGVQIIENNIKIRISENSCTADGMIFTNEEIGRAVVLVPESDSHTDGE